MYVLFNEEKHSKEDLQNELKTNPNIIEPKNEQLESFTSSLKLMQVVMITEKLFVEENYKARILTSQRIFKY